MKLVDAGYTGKHPYSFQTGVRALITGVKWAQQDSELTPRPVFELVYPNGETDSVPIYEGWRREEYLVAGEVSACYDATLEDIEVEALAREMCEATHGEGSSDWIVNRSNMPVIGTTGMRFILPNRLHQMPMWQDFIKAAIVAIGKAKK